MPNFYNDDDDGYYSCKYCHRRIPVEDAFHVCTEAREAGEAQNKRFEENYMANGVMFKHTIVLEVESYNSEMALHDVLQNFAMEYPELRFNSDPVLKWRWWVK